MSGKLETKEGLNGVVPLSLTLSFTQIYIEREEKRGDDDDSFGSTFRDSMPCVLESVLTVESLASSLRPGNQGAAGCVPPPISRLVYLQ